MRYGVVFLLSLGVGALVYVLSLRAAASEPVAVGFEPEEPSSAESTTAEPTTGEAGPPTVAGPPPGYTYLQVAITDGPSMRQRLQGLIGTIVMVALGAAAVAASFWALGSAVDRVIRSFFG
jgi:hypothetical protein